MNNSVYIDSDVYCTYTYGMYLNKRCERHIRLVTLCHKFMTSNSVFNWLYILRVYKYIVVWYYCTKFRNTKVITSILLFYYFMILLIMPQISCVLICFVYSDNVLAQIWLALRILKPATLVRVCLQQKCRTRYDVLRNRCTWSSPSHRTGGNLMYIYDEYFMNV